MYNQKPLLGELPDFSHPLTPNVAAWLFNESSGNKAFDSINKYNATLYASWCPEGLLIDANAEYAQTPTIPHGIGSGEFTWIIKVRVDSLSNSYHCACANNTYAPGLYTKITGGYWGVYWASFLSSGNTLSVGNTYTLAIKRVGDTLYFFENGVKTSSSASVSDKSMSDAIFVMGNSIAGGAGWELYGAISYVYFYDYALSDSQISQLCYDPYCWLAQPMEAKLMYAAPPVGAIINQFQKANLGADLYNGVLIT